ncbi:terminase family protein [Desulfovibrio sp.]|uniref:terminase large subunit domain-containing protein n=1 Tax=Desulfovibrio sp. TaxID=885 RepID=UPI00307B0E4F
MRVTIPYKPRDLSVHERLEAARFSVVAAHRRYGKTVLAVNHTIKGALTCNKPRGSFAYVAPFRNQAKAVAWDYLKYYTSPIPGRTVNESELSIMLPNGARIRIYGADNPDSLRGLYFDGVVLDEVADMKPEVWGEIIQPALADREGWALFIGTPHGINLFSELYYRALERQQKGDPLWCAMSFPVTGTTSLPPAEVERLRAELSENAWRQEMLCDFTASSDDILIPLPDVLEAEARQLAWDDVGGMPVILGVDVARFGADSSVIVRRQGLKADGPVVMRGLDNMQLADRVAAGGKLPDEGDDVPRLRAELSAPLYWYDAAGRMVLEPKDKIKERLGASPDIADALALTFAAPVALPEPGQEMFLPEQSRDAHGFLFSWDGGEDDARPW